MRKERAKGSEPYYLRINGKLDKLEAVLEFVFNTLSDLPEPVTKEAIKSAYEAVLAYVNTSGEDPNEKLLKAAFEHYLNPPAPEALERAIKPILEWVEA
ncbi:hypothetical protein [Adhaeribacter soli]|uniref:Uncharacterized protein n=1 Tax=Adhaeribacter soli TaxID=2607655 RepID=A0A5N1IK69_9BACT|nr:hypothetical protein [Adhaeribacter soli]KAA9325044.1 hypothetical protein F0P94_19255 [Adhaeribacter soli]